MQTASTRDVLQTASRGFSTYVAMTFVYLQHLQYLHNHLHLIKTIAISAIMSPINSKLYLHLELVFSLKFHFKSRCIIAFYTANL